MIVVAQGIRACAHLLQAVVIVIFHGGDFAGGIGYRNGQAVFVIFIADGLAFGFDLTG